MTSFEVARSLFLFGSLPFVIMGFAHAVLSFLDDPEPRRYVPASDEVLEGMRGTHLKIAVHVNMWRAWLGFNISHGLGLFLFGTVYLTITVFDFSFIVYCQPLIPIAIFGSAGYLLLALRYWFYAPAVGSGLGLVCFTAGYLFLH
ncbi:hypothetical protein MJD09_22090 [bacterium]|nr:hypothetical protein [bacterium]